MRIIIAEELKKTKQKKNLVLGSVDYNRVANNYRFPLEGRVVRLFQLNPSRNLWGSEARYYNPSDLSFDVDNLKTEAEKKRDYGKWFEIEPLYAIWLRFQTKNLIIAEFNTGKEAWFKQALETIKPMNLTDLWRIEKFYNQEYYLRGNYHSRWLNLFTVKSWSPDLLPKTSPEKYVSFPGQSGRSMGWNKLDCNDASISRNLYRSNKLLRAIIPINLQS